MQTLTYTFVDKSTWASGPWQDEHCDKMQWQDEATGMACLAVRGPSGGWCGYAGVPASHPYYGLRPSQLENVDVHGGITYANFCTGNEHGICHKVEPGEDDRVWWLGFDTTRLGDLMPAYAALWTQHGIAHRSLERDHYWTLDEIRTEVTNLAKQLKAIHDHQEAL